MDELEGRLRSALAEMAEEVPPSHHAWVEHQRRVAAKSRRDRRRPVLMAAAAAAVVALIAVPALILNNRGPESTQEAGQTTPPTNPQVPPSTGKPSLGPTPKYLPGSGETVVTEPILVTGSARNGVSYNTFVYTVRVAGSVQLCAVTQPNSVGQVVDGTRGHADFCAGLIPPPQGKYFWGGAIVTPPTSDIYIYVASPPTVKILLKEPDGSYQAAVRYTQSADFSLFISAGGIKRPTAASALDAAGNSLENR